MQCAHSLHPPLRHSCHLLLLPSQVTHHIAEGAKSTYRAAKRVDEKHQVHQKVGNVAKASYVKARDFDKKHEITSTIGRALLSGNECQRVATLSPFVPLHCPLHPLHDPFTQA